MPGPTKEAYFTLENIASRSQTLLADTAALVRLRSRPFDPRGAALLALDMQAYFLEPASHAFIPSAAAILPNIAALARSFLAQDRPVYFTRHINTAADAGMMARWWREIIAPGGPLADLLPGLVPPGARLLDKTQYDAFFDTDLEGDLHRAGVQQLVISGVMTHLCCETTARSAFMRGFEVFFPVDATATYTEAFHRATLLNLAHGFAVPVLTAALLDGSPK